MIRPVIKTFRCRRTPWQVFRTVAEDHGVAFFLDSHAYAPPSQRYSYIGFNPEIQIFLKKGRGYCLEKGRLRTFQARGIFKEMRKIFKRFRISKAYKKPFFSGGAVGHMNYETAVLFEKIRLKKNKRENYPKLFFGFYRDLIVFDHRKQQYQLITHVPDSSPAVKSRVQAAARIKKLKEVVLKPCRAEASFELKNFRAEITPQKFQHMVRTAKEYISAGDIYQANLSQRFVFDYVGDPANLYGALRDINPSPFASMFKVNDFYIISSSPERLIRKQGEICQTEPIAGTRPRFKINGRKKDFSKELRQNEKEKAEHIMLVDLERNDLGRVCRWPTVKVSEMMKIEKYSHVIHLVSTVTGTIAQGKDSFDLIRAMFPGGTITGCPKIRCMQIIDELEPEPRGIYTGSIGYIDFHDDADLNIVIRTLVLQNKQGHLQVGAGIVYDSDPGREYEETLHKGQALVEALKAASKETTGKKGRRAKGSESFKVKSRTSLS